MMTGLSAFAWDWMSFAIVALPGRRRDRLGMGRPAPRSIAELWPDKNRGKGVGLMQCGFGIGFFLASLAWLFIGPMGPDAWRVMFLLGVLPALLTLWIRVGIPESDNVGATSTSSASAALERQKSGAALDRRTSRRWRASPWPTCSPTRRSGGA